MEHIFCRFIGLKRAKSTWLDLKLVFWWVLRDSASIKTTGTNRVRIVQQMHVAIEQTFCRFIHNDHVQSTLLDPKHMFWCVFNDSSSVKIVGTERDWVVHRMHETVRTNFLSIYWHQTCQIYLISPKTHILKSFAWFCEYENDRNELGTGFAPVARYCSNKLSVDLFATNVPKPPY